MWSDGEHHPEPRRGLWSRVRQRRRGVRGRPSTRPVCADEIAGKRFRKGLIDADSVEDAAAMIQAQIYREWGVAIVKGRAECLLALLECTVPNASPRSKVACGKSRDKLIERANVAHCSGGFAEAVLLRRRYAVMKEAARARRR